MVKAHTVTPAYELGGTAASHDDTNSPAGHRSDIITQAHSIFQQPFWLDVVAQNKWHAVEVKVAGEIRARLPYVIGRNRLGLTTLTMAPLSRTLGPWIAPQGGKYNTDLARQKDLMTSLIEGLPQHDLFSQSFHYSITNWLPFYWKGFDQSTCYTYVIEDLNDVDRIWAEMRANIRTDIRKAKKQVVVRTDLGIGRFLDINALTFQRQGQNVPYSRDLVERLDAACAKRQMRRIFFAEDARGRIHAAILIVWDKDSAHYLLGGSDPELRNSGATSLLLWEAIQFAATVTQKFDFEGSMMESVERFFRAFGAKQKAYSKIVRMSPRMRFVRSLADSLSFIKTPLDH